MKMYDINQTKQFCIHPSLAIPTETDLCALLKILVLLSMLVAFQQTTIPYTRFGLMIGNRPHVEMFKISNNCQTNYVSDFYEIKNIIIL